MVGEQAETERVPLHFLPATKEARAVLLENLINSPADHVCCPSDRPGKTDPDSWKLSEPLQQHGVTKEVLLREYQTAVNAADFNGIIVTRGKRRSGNNMGRPLKGRIQEFYCPPGPVKSVVAV